MAATWGISRTMAEVQALLYITGEALCTDDIMERLQISRGNTSMNLRQLVNWGLIRRTHRRGDRKEYFVSELDAWELFDTIIRERRRREVQPIIETIERCRDQIGKEIKSLKGQQRAGADDCDKRLKDMLDFIHAMNTLLNLVLAAGRGKLGQLTIALSKLAPKK